MMSDWTELLNDYYDYIKVGLFLIPIPCFLVFCDGLKLTYCNKQGYLSTHALDRNNMGLCFETYWDAVSKVIILIQGYLGTGDKIIQF